MHDWKLEVDHQTERIKYGRGHNGAPVVQFSAV